MTAAAENGHVIRTIAADAEIILAIRAAAAAENSHVIGTIAADAEMIPAIRTAAAADSGGRTITTAAADKEDPSCAPVTDRAA